MPRVSVIVPFRNAERHLAACLRALAAQEPFDGTFEVLAADDGSTDGSPGLVSDLDGARLVRAEGRGAYAARNAAIAVAQGDVLAFTDADCAPAPDWLSTLVTALEDERVAVVVGSRLTAGTSAALSLVETYEQAKDEFIFGSGIPSLYYGSTNNMAVRREVFAAHGPFLERRRGADTLLVRRIVEDLGTDAVRYRPDARVRHLEIATLADYYRKLFVYGRSIRRLGAVAAVRPLRTRERLHVWRSAVRQRGASRAEAAALLAVLSAGALFWWSGQLAAPVPVPRP
jgi:glycosyltransferase involved in cell wall biosynthesis